MFSYAQDSGDGRAEATEVRKRTEERKMPNKDAVILSTEEAGDALR